MDAKKILVVDGEKKILRAMERVFFEDRFETITASSPGEGLEILGTVTPIQVVISGFRVPGMDGIEFLRRVKRRWPHAVRVILSGCEDRDAIVSAMDEGRIDRMIVRPWHNDELRNSIANALEMYELRRKNRELVDELDRKHSALQDLNDRMEETIATKTEELGRIQQDLSQAERTTSLQTMAAGIVGNLSAPLSSIMKEIGYMQSAAPGDARIVDGSERIMGDALRAEHVVGGLCAFSRMSCDPKMVDMIHCTDMIDDIVSDLECQIRLRQVEVVRKIYAGRTVMVMDSARMRETFINVLSNAIEAMPHGGTIIIRSRRVRDRLGRGFLQLTFADTGCGIPGDVIRHVFDPFYTTGKEQGKTGLGLSIAKGIVEAHGGSIRIESRVDAGTKVFIRLPVENECSDET